LAQRILKKARNRAARCATRQQEKGKVLWLRERRCSVGREFGKNADGDRCRGIVSYARRPGMEDGVIAACTQVAATQGVLYGQQKLARVIFTLLLRRD